MSRPPAEVPLTAEFPWPAPAKINLFLHVVGRRADGLHELQTVFQFLDHGDTLFFRPRGDGICQRENSVPGIPQEDDLAVRAAQLLSQASGCGLGADIRVEKRLPIGGGLGGGSSDAATTLVALNRMWNLGFTRDELANVGLKLGSDVPVFVHGYASFAEGVGERLSTLELPEPWFLVVTPPVAVSTREIFEAPELKRDTLRITARQFRAGSGTRNDCEPVTVARHPVVGEALERLRKFAPARMSGTGSSVFAAFASRPEALMARSTLPAAWSSFIARGLNESPLARLRAG
ncbi:MAG: 4-(cytidine 5'-diphospho)-2-C-methyl-D-erythritol kinase [Panacagrimonas sp.]